MKPYRLHPEALREAEEAAAFYQERQSGLERRFLEALQDAIAHIRRHPLLYRRRWPLHKPHEDPADFPMEGGRGTASRWNTLRALRVMEWFSGSDSTSRGARG
jgi:hypothetical protein